MHFRQHISCFCSISTTKIIPNTATIHSFASLSNMTVFRSWMNQLFVTVHESVCSSCVYVWCVYVCASSLSNCSWRINQSAPAAAHCATYIRLAVCVNVVGSLILSCFLSALCFLASRAACTGLICTNFWLTCTELDTLHGSRAYCLVLYCY